MNINNKNLVAVISVIVAIIIAWFGWRSLRPPEILNIDSKGTSVIAFGDSLVLGVGSTPGNDFVSLLSGAIGRPIINLGKSGDTTASDITRLDSVFEHDPKIVIVLLGGNDYLRRVPMNEIFTNLGRIVDTIQSRGAAVLLLGVRGGLLYYSYDDRFKNFASDNRTGFVPNVLDSLIGDTRLMSDSIHPNDAGYVKITEKVVPVLRQILNN